MTPRFLRQRLAWLAACVLPLTAHAQYPDRPITLLVPFPPGGVADTVARPVAEALGRELGQTVLVDNKAGAGGAIGIGTAARAPADGYTVLMTLSSISVLPVADRILERKPAYQLDQFVPIARVTADPTVLVVRADAPWKTLADFVKDAKAKPGAYNYGSSGLYGSMHVPMEMLKASAGINLTHVPFTGAGPAITALLGKQVEAIATGPSSVAQHIKAGTLRPLAHWGDQPLQALPDVPSLKAEGYPVQFVQWSGLFVPAATPPEVVQRLRDASRKVLAAPDVRTRIEGSGSPVQYLDAPEFNTYWKDDAAMLEAAVIKIGKVE